MKPIFLLLLATVPILAAPVNVSTMAAKTFNRRTNAWNQVVYTPAPIQMQGTNSIRPFWSPEAKAARGAEALKEYNRTNNVPVNP